MTRAAYADTRINGFKHLSGCRREKRFRVASPASRLLQGLTAGAAQGAGPVTSAAAFMPYTAPFPTQPLRSPATFPRELRIAIPPDVPAASQLARDLCETLNIPRAQRHAVPDDVRVTQEAVLIFQCFWKYVDEMLKETAGASKATGVTSPSRAPKPPWEAATRTHLQNTAMLLARRGMRCDQVARRFQAQLADIRSDRAWLCLTRGIGRDAAPFAVGSVFASIIATIIGPHVGSVLAGRLAMHVISGLVIMLTNTAGAALFETTWPSLREKLSQTTPAPGLEPLNSSLHSQLREFVVSCAAYAGCYGLIRNPLRLLIESRIPGIMAGPWKDIVHASMELALAMVGVPLRASLDHFRVSENDAAMELLLQADLADLLTDPAEDGTQTASFCTAFSERFSKGFCSKTTGLLGTLLTFAFAGIEWRDDVAARANTFSGERTLLNQLDFSYLYAAIGGLLQVALGEARSNDIKTAYLRRAPDQRRHATDVEWGEIPPATDTREPPKISTGSLDSGIQCFQCELQSTARRDGNWPPQGSRQRSSLSSNSVFESPSVTPSITPSITPVDTPPDTPPDARWTSAPPLPAPSTFARIRRPSVVMAQRVQPALETVVAMPDSLGNGRTPQSC
ncbi:hypothetical protein PIN31009_02789 [Pandoraea iniqua]|uniref:hypothetical protein n=1 Tax=Pandoraea iniqua TaxID=2508288 RepID=UPI0012418D16|nr:hypothetical protein [Pandoraea iniqua]VVE14186.1 hypothetical protein PIN31009_02789 [Pandoraea iniqua]